jgi:RHS repeat-associated protein
MRDCSHKFTGKERDTESGNDYFGARYYASSMGRFMSVDPAFESEILELPQTWNRYSYVYNRPTYSNDPDGRCPPCIGALVGGAIEGGFDLGKQLYNNG